MPGESQTTWGTITSCLPTCVAAKRLSSVLPYQVVMLSLDMERQKLSFGSARLVQRSTRAKSPSMRGR